MSWKQANWRTLVIEYRPMKAASASKLDEVIRMHIGKIAKEKSEFKGLKGIRVIKAYKDLKENREYKVLKEFKVSKDC